MLETQVDVDEKEIPDESGKNHVSLGSKPLDVGTQLSERRVDTSPSAKEETHTEFAGTDADVGAAEALEVPVESTNTRVDDEAPQLQGEAAVEFGFTGVPSKALELDTDPPEHRYASRSEEKGESSSDCKELSPNAKVAEKHDRPVSINSSKLRLRRVAPIAIQEARSTEAKSSSPLPEESFIVRQSQDLKRSVASQLDDESAADLVDPAQQTAIDAKHDITGDVVSVPSTPAVVLLPGIVRGSSRSEKENDDNIPEQDLDGAGDLDTSESEECSIDSYEDEVSEISLGEVVFSEDDVQSMITEFYELESEAAEAQEKLEDESLNAKKISIKSELSERLSGSELDTAVEEEFLEYKELWEEEYDGLQEKISLLQDKLQLADISLPYLYKEIEKQAPQGSMTETWKRRIHWIGHTPTQEGESYIKKADEVLEIENPVRSRRGKLRGGASGFLERKLTAEVAKDGGPNSSRVYDVEGDGGWSELDDVLDNDSAPEPGRHMDAKKWAAVYLASTPEHAAQLGLALPGVDIVEEIGDVDSERRPAFKAAFANEKERGLTDRQKQSITKVREEDDAKECRRSYKWQRKSTARKSQSKSLVESQHQLAGMGSMNQQEKLSRERHETSSSVGSGKASGVVRAADGVPRGRSYRVECGDVEHAQNDRRPEGPFSGHLVVGPASAETVWKDAQLAEAETMFSCEALRKGTEFNQCDQGAFASTSRANHQDKAFELTCPEPRANDSRPKRAREEGFEEGQDLATSKRSKNDSLEDQVGLSNGNFNEIHSFEEILTGGYSSKEDENHGRSPTSTALYRTTVIIDSDGEREVEEAVTEHVLVKRGFGSGHRLQNESLLSAQDPPVNHFAESVEGTTHKSELSDDSRKRKSMPASGNGVRDFPCTACGILMRKKDVLKHPKLPVGICRKCKHHYLSGPFLKDEDGSESECRWCGEGGDVVCCSECDKVFCQECITRNFGDKETARVVMSDNWICYSCNRLPLSHLTSQLTLAELEAQIVSGDKRVSTPVKYATGSLQDSSGNYRTNGRHRRNIRKVLDDNELEEKQKKLLTVEKERQERIEEWRAAAPMETSRTPSKRDVFTGISNENRSEDSGVINVARASNEDRVWISPSLATKLKAHQINGVRFMWENCIVSEKTVQDGKLGFGCILAHSMGLGKTLQVITFIHTVLNRDLGLRKALIVVPRNVLHNWKREFDIWQARVNDPVSVRMLEESIRDNTKRAALLREWETFGGVMLIGYASFRNLCMGKHVREKSARDDFCRVLQNPGPDLLVCDEAHTIKNTKADITQVLKQVKTRRRIALTGSPVQNNLMEYYCMVDFVREGHLGSPQIFKNRFQNPIENGQHADSTSSDVRLMKQRSHVLHKELKGFVQRMGTSVLKNELPPKCAYVMSVRLSPLQRQLYLRYLQLHGFPQGNGEAMEECKSQRRDLLHAYHSLSKVWNHPELLLLANERARRQEDNLDDFTGDSDEEKLNDGDIDGDEGKAKLPTSHDQLKKSSSNLHESEKALWWKGIINDSFVRENMEFSGKMVLLLSLLTMCALKGDKALVFSQSLDTLTMIERFLEKSQTFSGNGPGWEPGKHWFRLDGSTPAAVRMQMCESFNNPTNETVRCFLISTRAGSLGINLPAANRVIIFDGSWNPTHDLQAVFRAWRLGQKKPVYAYRLLAHGTMEEKIYSRQVAKEGVAARVLDEQQVGRHFDGDDLDFLFRLDEDGDDFVFEGRQDSVRILPGVAPVDQGRIAPAGSTPPLLLSSKSKLWTFTGNSDAPPRDDLMANLLLDYRPRWIVGYHEHEPLLEHKDDETLTPEEQQAAWDSYRDSYMDMMHSTSIQTENAQQPVLGVSFPQPILNKTPTSCSGNYHAAILKQRAVEIKGSTVCDVCSAEICWETLTM